MKLTFHFSGLPLPRAEITHRHDHTQLYVVLGMELRAPYMLGKLAANLVLAPVPSKKAFRIQHASLESRKKHLASPLMAEPKQSCKHC